VSAACFLIRPSAAAELDAIEEYLSEHASPDIAAAFLDAATDAFRLLATQPEIGRRWEAPLRRIHDACTWPLRIHQGYVIFYRPLAPEPGVEILHVFHGARDILALLNEEEP
jgi:plasmid stabilization system protein ParE